MSFFSRFKRARAKTHLKPVLIGFIVGCVLTFAQFAHAAAFGRKLPSRPAYRVFAFRR